MLFLSNSYFSGLSGSNMPAFSYNPKKNAPNPAVRENYLNSFLYVDFFASRGGSKRLQTKKEPGKRLKTFTGLLESLFIHETQYHYRIQILFTATRV